MDRYGPADGRPCATSLCHPRCRSGVLATRAHHAAHRRPARQRCHSPGRIAKAPQRACRVGCCDSSGTAPSRSARRREELNCDPVGIAEAHPRAVCGVLDPAVDDTKLIESARPGVQRCAIRAAESNVIKTNSVLAELFVECRLFVLVKSEERISKEVNGVVEIWVCVFVKYWCG